MQSIRDTMRMSHCRQHVIVNSVSEQRSTLSSAAELGRAHQARCDSTTPPPPGRMAAHDTVCAVVYTASADTLVCLLPLSALVYLQWPRAQRRRGSAAPRAGRVPPRPQGKSHCAVAASADAHACLLLLLLCNLLHCSGREHSDVEAALHRDDFPQDG
jgi:hypothetical protein